MARYVVELLGHDETSDEYAYVGTLADFGDDLDGASEYAMRAARDGTVDAPTPFMVSVNWVNGGCGRPTLGYVRDGERVERVTFWER